LVEKSEVEMYSLRGIQPLVIEAGLVMADDLKI
jgi:hypothetical protein